MSAMDALVGLLAILACAGVLYFIFTSNEDVQPTALPRLEVVSPDSGKVNQPVQVVVRAHASTGSTLNVTSEEQVHTLSCQSDPCSFDVAFNYSTPGEKNILAQSGLLSVSRTIDVKLSLSVCIDGTLEGECSITQPLRCADAKLVSDCTMCGCPSSQLCQNAVCGAPPLSMSLIVVEFPQKIYSTSVSPVEITLQNNSEYSVNGLFLVFVDEYANTKKTAEHPQQVSLQNWSSTTQKTFSIPVVFAPSTTHAGVRVYDAPQSYPQSTLLAETSSLIPISVNVDTTPPEGVGNLAYEESEDGVLLNWDSSPSEDVVKYVVYQENFSTGGFTTYSTLGETSSTSYSLAESSTPLAYVVKAVDGAGNASDASQPVVVQAS